MECWLRSKLKARTTDVGESLNGSNSLDLTELNIDNELGLFKGAAVIGFGAEYNVLGLRHCSEVYL